MIEDVISNDCNISDTFINSANIAPNNIDKQIDRQVDRIDIDIVDKIHICNYIKLYYTILSQYTF